MATKRSTPHPVRPVASADRALVERLRRICLALPDADERLSHGEPTWFAGRGKVFAQLDDHHHRSPHLSVWLPMPFGAQEALVARDPHRFFRPAYVGSSGWVAVVLDTGPDWDEVARLVREAYLQVAARKLKARLSGAAHVRSGEVTLSDRRGGRGARSAGARGPSTGRSGEHTRQGQAQGGRPRNRHGSAPKS
jgi:hypothetical protein